MELTVLLIIAYAGPMHCRLVTARASHRTSCWIALTTMLIAGQGPQAAAQMIPVPVREVLVEDAMGRVVGPAFDVQGAASVALDIGGQLVIIRVARDRITGTADADLVYESNDCTGQAYAPAGLLSIGPSLTAVVVTYPKGTVYVGDPGATPQLISYRSAYLSDPDGSGRCDTSSGRQSDAFPVTALVDLYDLFTPPFHLAAAPTPTATGTVTAASPPTPTPTIVSAATVTPTDAPVPTLTPTVGAAPACCGDCNEDGAVTVDEVITSVNALLFGCETNLR